jgi:hypothetical protein
MFAFLAFTLVIACGLALFALRVTGFFIQAVLGLAAALFIANICDRTKSECPRLI